MKSCACREASEHFGTCLTPYLPVLVRSDGTKPFAEQTDLPAEMSGAIITDHGQLTPSACIVKIFGFAAWGCKRCTHESSSSLSASLSLSLAAYACNIGRLRTRGVADFGYISDLRKSNDRATQIRDAKRFKSECGVCVKVQGHIFDTGLINKVCGVWRMLVCCEPASLCGTPVIVASEGFRSWVALPLIALRLV